jgi:hypothetical protein
MTLKVDLRQFLDEQGHVLALTEQAKTIFKFLTKIVSSVSENIEQPLIDVQVKCDTRASGLICEGEIKAKSIELDNIEWHCDTCEATGTISNWRESIWDKQARTIH